MIATYSTRLYTTQTVIAFLNYLHSMEHLQQRQTHKITSVRVHKEKKGKKRNRKELYGARYACVDGI